MEITGKVVTVLEIESGTNKRGNSWRKQNFVIETEDRYPKKACFQLFGERVNDCPAVGEEVNVNFEIESREWNGKWFTQLNAWKVEKNGANGVQSHGANGTQTQCAHGAQSQASATQAQPAPKQESSEDLPF